MGGATAFELGELLLAMGRAGDARARLQEAAEAAQALGIGGLAGRARRLLEPNGSLISSADLRVAAPAVTLERDGDVWRLRCGDRQVRVRESRGMEILARLIERPGEDVHVLTLAGAAGATLVEGAPGDALDATAARSYRARLADIDEELADAEARADLGRREALVSEREQLQAELGRAFGLGGAARPSGSASERARINVQRRVKDALARITELDPTIGEYLRAAVRTGTYCMFRP